MQQFTNLTKQLSQWPIAPLLCTHHNVKWPAAPRVCSQHNTTQRQRSSSSRRSHIAVARAANKDADAAAEEEATANTVSQALAAIGLSGTIAVSGAALCGVSLFGLFHWERLQDVQLALELNSVLLLLDAALFLPNYRVPASLCEEPQQQPGNGTSSSNTKQPLLDLAAVRAGSAFSLSSWRLMLAMLREALTRPQLQQLPLQVSAGLLAAREGSKELLQRGFVLTALAGWLTDRLYEADVGGLEGLVTLPGVVGVQLTVPETALWVSSLAATALFAPGAFLAAEEAAGGVSGAMLMQTEAGAAVAAAVAAGPAAAAGAAAKQKQQCGSSSSSSSSSSGQLSQGQQLEQQEGVVQAQEADDGDEEEDDEPLAPEVLEYRLVKATEACLTSAPTQLAYRLTLAKALGRLVLTNVVFVLTRQNLAATYASGLLSNVLLLLYGRLGRVSREEGGGSSSS